MKKIFIIILMTLPLLLHSDYVIVYNMDTDIITYTYKNNSTSKMVHTSKDGAKEIYVIDDNIYLVHDTPSGIKIKDANNLKIKKRVYDTNAYAAKQTKPNYEIRKTNRTKNIANIEGEVWMVFGRDGGQVYSQYVVVTDNPKVAKVMKNMYLAYSRKDGEILDLQNIFEIEPGYMLIKTDSMKLESFVEINLPETTYSLPKK